jgi:hypothetical protein
MMALLPLIVLAGLILLARRKSGDWLQGLVAGAVAWGCLLVVLTEGLSPFRALSAFWLTVVWTVCGILVGLVYRTSTPSPEQPSVFSGVDRNLVDRLALGFIVTSVLITFVIALFAMPSLWDAHTYHMPRVVHWVQNQSVAHYPTNMQRQLWSAPGAEFIVLHFYALGKSDRFLALVPWSAFVLSIAASSLIAKELGATPRGQLMASVFAASIPGAIAQSTGGQVDIVAGMWICCFVWLSLRLINSTDFSWPLVFLAGSALGLAFLTKPTIYLFALPFVIWFAIAALLKSLKRAIAISFSVAIIALALNVLHYRRNTDLFDHAVKGPGSGGIQMRSYSFKPLVSSFIRNSALHFGTRSTRINDAVFNTVTAAHRVLGISENDRSTTLMWTRFEPPVMNFSEATAGSPLHVALLTVAGIFLILAGRKQGRKSAALFVIAIGTGYLLFCLVLRWGEWNTRLQLPLLLLAAGPVGMWIGSIRGQSYRTMLLGLLSVGALPPLLLNPDRPLIRHRPVYAMPRDERYFVESRGLYPSYRAATDYITSTGCHRIGFWSGWNEWEYPLWALLRNRSFAVEIRHVQVTTASARMTATERSGFTPCMLIAIRNWPTQGSFIIPKDFAPTWQQDSIRIFQPVVSASSGASQLLQ